MKEKFNPIFFNFNALKTLVIGSGKIGLRRAEKLKSYGADVNVLSPSGSSRFPSVKKSYEASDLEGYQIVVAATNSPELNSQIVSDALDQAIPFISSVTKDKRVTFQFPAVLEKDGITIAVSTAGKSPGFAVELRDSLENFLTEERIKRFHLMASLREKYAKTAFDLSSLRRKTDEELEELL